MSLDLDSLNPPQKEAVLATEGPLLVLAGAGSGKTRVLTYRIASMIDEGLARPWEILAITFTNKAAAEMRERLSGLIGAQARGMWVSTFHSMCVRILRQDAEQIGYTRNFTIYDTDDQKRLVKAIMAELDLNPKLFQVNGIMNRISKAKNELIVAGEYLEQAVDLQDKAAARVYEAYQKRLRAANAMDFDDLLMYVYLLFKHHPDALRAYQERFRYVLVDEYQDTNHAQYVITGMLAAKSRNIMVVGDDDQSIYSWRGADIRNILEFEQDYPDAKVVKLEQNYRCTGNILQAANEVIAHNTQRKPKRLFTDAEAGEKISVYMAADERDEGRWIAGEIAQLARGGAGYDQMALFYRTNAQSRILEDMLLRAGVPYRIVGGTKFFDRAEIRHVMAYLSLVVNPADDVSFDRVVNVPRRGIGASTVEKIHEYATDLGLPLLDAAEQLLADVDVRAGVKRSLGEFLEIFREARTWSGDLRKVVERIIDRTGLIQSYEAEGTDEALARIENIREFFGVVSEFSETHQEEDAFFAAPGADAAVAGLEAAGSAGAAADGQLTMMALAAGASEGEAPAFELHGDSLPDLLEWVRLRTDLDAVTEDGRAVTLMTVHSAKGLEFDTVFVAGMEEGIFPHVNSTTEAAGYEEERRLAYVAITRARKKLYLTCAQTRKLYGQTSANQVSSFLRDIPSEVRETQGLGSAGFSGSGWEKRGSRRGIAGSGSEAGGGRVFGRSSASGGQKRSYASSARGTTADGKRAGAKETFKSGDVVDHKTFGRGKVVKASSDVVYVKFDNTGSTKKLLKDYAPIVKIS